MKLENVLSVLRQVAPEHLAEDWDQVGLHLAGTGKPVRKALLCIDLTPPVLAEAIAGKCQLIVAYHPPIFHPLKRLADRDWKEQMLAEAVRKGIAVYSPHTALDAVRPGMNDWLCDGLGEGAHRYSIGMPQPERTRRYKIVVYAPRKDAERLRNVMAGEGAGWIGHYTDCSFSIDGLGTFRGDATTHPAIGKPGQLEKVEETRFEMICQQNLMGQVLKAVREAHPYEEPAIDIVELAAEWPREEDEQTPGRALDLKKPVPATTLIHRLKKHLGLRHLKAAVPEIYGEDQPRAMNLATGEEITIGNGKTGKIRRIAVCVGAGGSLFEKYPGADAYITGEMQHHQVLDLYNKGKVVILAGHTNTERPFLKHYRDAIVEQGGDKVEWVVSEADVTPIGIV